MQPPTALAAAASGLALGASLIVAVGAQNTFVLRQGLRREHVGPVVALCIAMDGVLTSLGVAGLAASLGMHPRLLDALALLGAAFLLAVTWTVFTSTELPPPDLDRFAAQRKHSRNFGVALREIVGGFAHMPKTMVQLAFVQFFSWIALFALWIYTGPAIADNVYNTTDPLSAGYQEAGNWVGVMFAVYNGMSALAAFVLPVLARRTSRKACHAVCLAIGGLSLASTFFIHDKYLLLIPMLGVGVAWASILTMPYAILVAALPPNRMGYYMGLFNFFIVIPQIVSGLVLGWFTKHMFGNHAVLTLVLGGVSMVIAAVLALFVTDKAEHAGR